MGICSGIISIRVRSPHLMVSYNIYISLPYSLINSTLMATSDVINSTSMATSDVINSTLMATSDVMNSTSMATSDVIII